MRFKVEPGDVPEDKAARRMGLTLADFKNVKPRLIARGFPEPDPDTGNYDLDAIDRFRQNRHPHLFGEHSTLRARDASAVVFKRLKRTNNG